MVNLIASGLIVVLVGPIVVAGAIVLLFTVAGFLVAVVTGIPITLFKERGRS
jgi:hypothetical protein